LTAYTARRLPVHRGPAAWNEILGPGPAYPALEGRDRRCRDRRGGVRRAFRRASAAAAEPRAGVVVLEAGRVAEGAAGRNSGFMIDLPHDLASEDYAGAGDDRAMIALNRHAIGFARGAVADYGIDRNFFDPAGKVNGAASAAADAHNRSYAAHLATLGETSEMLDAQAMRELTGSAHYVSGLYTPGTVMLQPAGYIRGLRRVLPAMASHQ
jgi:glycine/D-amino acid oxidase-like deaminating enzyme